MSRAGSPHDAASICLVMMLLATYYAASITTLRLHTWLNVLLE